MPARPPLAIQQTSMRRINLHNLQQNESSTVPNWPASFATFTAHKLLRWTFYIHALFLYTNLLPFLLKNTFVDFVHFCTKCNFIWGNRNYNNNQVNGRLSNEMSLVRRVRHRALALESIFNHNVLRSSIYSERPSFVTLDLTSFKP